MLNLKKAINITILQHYIHNNKCKIDLVMCELFHDTFLFQVNLSQGKSK